METNGTEKDTKQKAKPDSEANETTEVHGGEEQSPQMESKDAQVEKKGRFTIKPQLKLEAVKSEKNFIISSQPPGANIAEAPHKMPAENMQEKSAVQPKGLSNSKFSTETPAHSFKPTSETNEKEESKKGEAEDNTTIDKVKPEVRDTSKSAFKKDRGSEQKEEGKITKQNSTKVEDTPEAIPNSSEKVRISTNQGSSVDHEVVFEKKYCKDEPVKKPPKIESPVIEEEKHVPKEEKKSTTASHPEEMILESSIGKEFTGEASAAQETVRNLVFQKEEELKTNSLFTNTPMGRNSKLETSKLESETNTMKNEKGKAPYPSEAKRELQLDLSKLKKIENERRLVEQGYKEKKNVKESRMRKPVQSAEKKYKNKSNSTPFYRNNERIPGVVHPGMLFSAKPSHNIEEQFSADEELEDVDFFEKPIKPKNETKKYKTKQKRALMQQLEQKDMENEKLERKFGKYQRKLTKLQNLYEEHLLGLQLLQGEMTRVISKMKQTKEKAQKRRSQLGDTHYRDLQRENAGMRSELAKLRSDIEAIKKHEASFK